MPNKDAGMSGGGAGAPQQPDRDEVQQWEDEGGATKGSAKQAKSGSEKSGYSDGPSGGRSGGKKASSSGKSRSRTGR